MKYRVAETPEDWAAVKELLRAEAVPEQAIKFPTIMAMDDEKLVGFIATQDRSDMVVAGPMVMRSDKRRVFTAKRLVILYQQVMMRLGMQKVVFQADEGDSILIEGIRRYFPEVQPYAKNGGTLFYNWTLGGAAA
jgi:hypothetical protein